MNVGEVSVALLLDSAGFEAGLAAARASLDGFAQELAALTIPPEVNGAEALASGLDFSSQFAEAGANAGAAFGTSVGTSARAALSASGAGASQAGAQLAQGFAAGIGAGASLAAAGAAGMANAALTAAQGRMNAASSAGRAFAAGLASGIRSGQSGVISAAVAVASAAAAAARSALAIHSPSKVTRELGENFDLGFIRGIDAMRPDIERSVRAAVQIEPPASVAYGAAQTMPRTEPASTQPIDYDRLADAMNRRQMVLTMDNRRLAELQERETARTQSARNRRIALGYGR